MGRAAHGFYAHGDYPAEARFGQLLDWHLVYWGTVPECNLASRNPAWKISAFAAAIHEGSSAAFGDENFEKKLRYYRKGQHLPESDVVVANIARLLFDNDRRLASWKSDLLNALRKERETKSRSGPLKAFPGDLLHRRKSTNHVLSRYSPSQLGTEEGASNRSASPAISLLHEASDGSSLASFFQDVYNVRADVAKAGLAYVVVEECDPSGEIIKACAYGVRPDKFQSTQQFLRALYGAALYNLVEPLSYGCDWLLASFEAEHLFVVPPSWIEQPRSVLKYAETEWLARPPESLGVIAGTAWHAVRGVRTQTTSHSSLPACEFGKLCVVGFDNKAVISEIDAPQTFELFVDKGAFREEAYSGIYLTRYKYVVVKNQYWTGRKFVNPSINGIRAFYFTGIIDESIRDFYPILIG